jgi:hypothetical protein
MIYDYYHGEQPRKNVWVVRSPAGPYRLFPSLAYVNHALRQDFLFMYKFHHTVRFSDVPSYVRAISTGLKYAAGVITVNIDKGETHGLGTVSVDMAPLLRLSIDKRAVMFKITWVESHFAHPTNMERLEGQCHLLESILAAPETPTTSQTSWLNYFTSTMNALSVYACVKEATSTSFDSYTLRVCVVVKKEFAEEWMTRDDIEAGDAERWASGSGYPAALLSITSFRTM